MVWSVAGGGHPRLHGRPLAADSPCTSIRCRLPATVHLGVSYCRAPVTHRTRAVVSDDATDDVATLQPPQAHAEAIPQQQGSGEEPAGASNPTAPAAKKRFRSQRQVTTSIYWWPRMRDLRDRPPFLERYPPDGASFNINSFLGPVDTHQGKYMVPQSKYQTFLAQYHAAYLAGYHLFYAEVYGSQPFRYFVELDFDWSTPRPLVEAVFKKLYPIIKKALKDTYQLIRFPTTVVSMRTPYKVHINCPWLVTTELHAMMCRDKIIEECRSQLGVEYSGLDWESIVDFPHGSFRMLGSRKTKHMVSNKEPQWVSDKAYYPVRFDLQQDAWVPTELSLERLEQSSIVPTLDQRQRFEKSSAYLGMIYTDASAYEQTVRERMQKRLDAQAAELRRLGVAVPAASSPGQDLNGQQQQQQSEQPQQPGSREGREATPSSGTQADEAAHSQRVMNAQLQKLSSVKLAAMKAQEARALQELAARSGETGQQYLRLIEQLERLTSQSRVSQSRLSLLIRQRDLNAASAADAPSAPGLNSAGAQATSVAGQDGNGNGVETNVEDEIEQLASLTKGVQRLCSQLTTQAKQLAQQMMKAQDQHRAAADQPKPAAVAEETPPPATPPSEAPAQEVITLPAPTLQDLKAQLESAKLELKRVQSPYVALRQMHSALQRQGRQPHPDDVKLVEDLAEQVKQRSREVSRQVSLINSQIKQRPEAPRDQHQGE